MKCAVKGDPFPEIKWYRNGTLVRDTTRTTIETTEEGLCTLTVTGQPMPQVKWSKDGGPIWEDSRYQWEIDETKVCSWGRCTVGAEYRT
ncbi:hypothetical protein ANCDUO_11361 [Ancylostoma duodenale]|uniref:Ig-like domain-containing protein n=1 Tax=Ancylostoma duodenale TaxID=51022 RepID=A0A0C2GBP6_9BILA|nr:hypothetical protein ANCDUO_11361 [Ancylostoma duodenale]